MSLEISKRQGAKEERGKMEIEREMSERKNMYLSEDYC
jgi:hypothetical protein